MKLRLGLVFYYAERCFRGFVFLSREFRNSCRTFCADYWRKSGNARASCVSDRARARANPQTPNAIDITRFYSIMRAIDFVLPSCGGKIQRSTATPRIRFNMAFIAPCLYTQNQPVYNKDKIHGMQSVWRQVIVTRNKYTHWEKKPNFLAKSQPNAGGHGRRGGGVYVMCLAQNTGMKTLQA